MKAQEQLEAKGFQTKINSNPKGQILDVRTAEEFSGGHISKAQNIDYYQLSFRKEVARLDKSKPVFVYCSKGVRSVAACSILKSMGFKEIYNLKKGFDSWKEADLKIEK